MVHARAVNAHACTIWFLLAYVEYDAAQQQTAAILCTRHVLKAAPAPKYTALRLPAADGRLMSETALKAANGCSQGCAASANHTIHPYFLLSVVKQDCANTAMHSLCCHATSLIGDTRQQACSKRTQTRAKLHTSQFLV